MFGCKFEFQTCNLWGMSWDEMFQESHHCEGLFVSVNPGVLLYDMNIAQNNVHFMLMIWFHICNQFMTIVRIMNINKLKVAFIIYLCLLSISLVKWLTEISESE